MPGFLCWAALQEEALMKEDEGLRRGGHQAHGHVASCMSHFLFKCCGPGAFAVRTRHLGAYYRWEGKANPGSSS